MKVTALPASCVHLVSGSVPSCSFVTPVAVVVAEPGNWTGIGTVQELLDASTVTPVMWVLSAE